MNDLIPKQMSVTLLFLFLSLYQRLVMCTAGNSEDIPVIILSDDDDEEDEKESDLSCLIVDVKDNKSPGKADLFCTLLSVQVDWSY